MTLYWNDIFSNYFLGSSNFNIWMMSQFYLLKAFEMKYKGRINFTDLFKIWGISSFVLIFFFFQMVEFPAILLINFQRIQKTQYTHKTKQNKTYAMAIHKQ